MNFFTRRKLYFLRSTKDIVVCLEKKTPGYLWSLLGYKPERKEITYGRRHDNWFDIETEEPVSFSLGVFLSEVYANERRDKWKKNLRS